VVECCGFQLRNPEIADFVNITKFLKKTELLVKFALPDKRVLELMGWGSGGVGGV